MTYEEQAKIDSDAAMKRFVRDEWDEKPLWADRKLWDAAVKWSRDYHHGALTFQTGWTYQGPPSDKPANQEPTRP